MVITVMRGFIRASSTVSGTLLMCGFETNLQWQDWSIRQFAGSTVTKTLSAP
jgi:hypothetical protein